MTDTLPASASAPSTSVPWDEQIVPALRRRLEQESEFLTKRLSRLSAGSASLELARVAGSQGTGFGVGIGGAGGGGGGGSRVVGSTVDYAATGLNGRPKKEKGVDVNEFGVVPSAAPSSATLPAAAATNGKTAGIPRPSPRPGHDTPSDGFYTPSDPVEPARSSSSRSHRPRRTTEAANAATASAISAARSRARELAKRQSGGDSPEHVSSPHAPSPYDHGHGHGGSSRQAPPSPAYDYGNAEDALAAYFGNAGASASGAGLAPSRVDDASAHGGGTGPGTVADGGAIFRSARARTQSQPQLFTPAYRSRSGSVGVGGKAGTGRSAQAIMPSRIPQPSPRVLTTGLPLYQEGQQRATSPRSSKKRQHQPSRIPTPTGALSSQRSTSSLRSLRSQSSMESRPKQQPDDARQPTSGGAALMPPLQAAAPHKPLTTTTDRDRRMGDFAFPISSSPVDRQGDFDHVDASTPPPKLATTPGSPASPPLPTTPPTGYRSPREKRKSIDAEQAMLLHEFGPLGGGVSPQDHRSRTVPVMSIRGGGGRRGRSGEGDQNYSGARSVSPTAMLGGGRRISSEEDKDAKQQRRAASNDQLSRTAAATAATAAATAATAAATAATATGEESAAMPGKAHARSRSDSRELSRFASPSSPERDRDGERSREPQPPWIQPEIHTLTPSSSGILPAHSSASPNGGGINWDEVTIPVVAKRLEQERMLRDDPRLSRVEGLIETWDRDGAPTPWAVRRWTDKRKGPSTMGGDLVEKGDESDGHHQGLNVGTALGGQSVDDLSAQAAAAGARRRALGPGGDEAFHLQNLHPDGARYPHVQASGGVVRNDAAGAADEEKDVGSGCCKCVVM